jgi:hypothetical protein
MVSGTRGLCREAALRTRFLALLGSNDGKTAALWFADVPEPAVGEEMAAAAVSTLRDDPPRFGSRSAALVDGALQSIQLSGNSIK